MLPFLVARAFLAAALLFAVMPSALSQTVNRSVSNTTAGAKKDALPQADEKAEQILKRAVEAMGGGAYLGVRAVVSRGYFTQYREGVNGVPVTFVDYLVFPDRERTEFKGSGVRSIQTNTGETGWLFDGMVKKIKDLTPEQVEDFRFAMRTSLDNVLRGWWRGGGAKLTYVGRREGGLGTRNEAVRLTYPDGFTVDYEFGARDFLPAKALYKKKNKEGEEVEEEDRYAQRLTVDGVVFAFVIDHYRAGQQTSRVNYERVEINTPVPDSLFTRPADVKSLK